MVVDGVTVEYVDGSGAVRGAQVRVVDFDAPEANDWLAVNQFTVVENEHERRPDIVLFVNGLPLGIVELKHPTDESATIRSGFQQLQTYKAEIPSLFAFKRCIDRVGRITAPFRYGCPRMVEILRDQGTDGRTRAGSNCALRSGCVALVFIKAAVGRPSLKLDGHSPTIRSFHQECGPCDSRINPASRPRSNPGVRGGVDSPLVASDGLRRLPRGHHPVHHGRCGREQRVSVARLEA